MEVRGTRGDPVTGVVLLVLTVVGFWRLYGNQDVTTLDFGNDPGPGLFPKLLLWALGLAGLWLIVQALARWRARGGEAGASTWEARRLLLPGLMMTTLAGYVLILPRFGFLAVTCLFSFVWILLLSIEEGARLTWSRLLRFVAEAGVLSALIYLVFAKLVRVPLP
ncbi:MAG TPA: tripartite tricarboxylate transporter TctB family protein [Candidatus Methylomirabilis sp.]